MASKIAWALPGLILLSGVVACSSGTDTTAPADVTTTTGTPDDDDTSTTTDATSSTTGGGGEPGTGGSGPTTGAGGDPEPPPDCTPGGPICTTEPPGQAEVDSRLHSCRMVQYDSLGRILADFGVPITGTGNQGPNGTPTAGQLYNDTTLYPDGPFIGENQRQMVLRHVAEEAFGIAKEQSRSSDRDFHTTSSALKLFDIFIQAAETIITQMPSRPHCMKGGQPTAMFDANDSCNPDAITCLIGYPATEDHTLLCDLIIDKADPGDTMDVRKKKIIAVATLLAAAHTCE